MAEENTDAAATTATDYSHVDPNEVHYSLDLRAQAGAEKWDNARVMAEAMKDEKNAHLRGGKEPAAPEAKPAEAATTATEEKKVETTTEAATATATATTAPDLTKYGFTDEEALNTHLEAAKQWKQDAEAFAKAKSVIDLIPEIEDPYFGFTDLRDQAQFRKVTGVADKQIGEALVSMTLDDFMKEPLKAIAVATALNDKYLAKLGYDKLIAKATREISTEPVEEWTDDIKAVATEKALSMMGVIEETKNKFGTNVNVFQTLQNNRNAQEAARNENAAKWDSDAGTLGQVKSYPVSIPNKEFGDIKFEIAVSDEEVKPIAQALLKDFRNRPHTPEQKTLFTQTLNLLLQSAIQSKREAKFAEILTGKIRDEVLKEKVNGGDPSIERGAGTQSTKDVKVNANSVAEAHFRNKKVYNNQ